MKNVSKSILTVAATLLLTATTAYAGQAEITIENSTNTTIEDQNATCLASGSFPATIGDASSAVVNTTGASTYYSCSVKYDRDDNSRGCKFVISRFWNVGFPPYISGYWQVPNVTVYEDYGMDCSYTFTSISLDGSGDFDVRLTVDD